MPTIPMEYVRNTNRSCGGHFFDNEAMRFFDSRIESKEAHFNVNTQDAFFVTSERLFDKRLFKVRKLDENGRVRTVSPRPLLDRDQAFEMARDLASA